jgi:hypothetical protein
MTDEEWEEQSVALGTWWSAPTRWSPEQAGAYRVALELVGATSADVGRALAVLLQSGSAFRPSAAEIVAVLAPPTRRPSPEHAWDLVRQAIRKVGRSVYAADFDERHQAAIDWLAEQDPVVAAWAARRGLCGHGSLGMEDVAGEHGGAALHRLAQDYRQVVAAAQERERLGQPAVTPAQLQVRRTGQGGPQTMRELVENLRPAPQLEPGSTA